MKVKFDISLFDEECEMTYPTVSHIIPFNVEKAKKGAKVITRDGKPARILSYDLKGNPYSIVAAITDENGREQVENYTIDGRFDPYHGEVKFDLMLQITGKEGWMPIIEYSHNRRAGVLFILLRNWLRKTVKELDLI